MRTAQNCAVRIRGYIRDFGLPSIHPCALFQRPPPPSRSTGITGHLHAKFGEVKYHGLKIQDMYSLAAKVRSALYVSPKLGRHQPAKKCARYSTRPKLAWVLTQPKIALSESTAPNLGRFLTQAQSGPSMTPIIFPVIPHDHSSRLDSNNHRGNSA